MKKTNLLIISIILSTIIFISCSIMPRSKTSQLSGTSWSLISYSKSKMLPKTSMTAQFNGSEIRGTGGCNTYFGSYTISGSSLKIKELGWTEMACMDPEGIMEQEQVLMFLLSDADSYFIDGSTLQIITASGESLVFERVN